MRQILDVLRDDFDLTAAVYETQDRGYSFASDALVDTTRLALEGEINNVPLEVGDHTAKPINAGKRNEVRQQHERFYASYGNEQTLVANLVIDGLVRRIQAMRQFPELSEWQPTEIGYQKYRSSHDFIGPHRDRQTDQLLSVTFTITGSAAVRIFETTADHWDYSQLIQTDEYATAPGSVMMLRAPRFGNGDQIVHQVLPPAEGDRSILNLRMRPTILEQPGHPKWQK